MSEHPKESLIELPPDHPNLPIKPPFVFLWAIAIAVVVHVIRPVSVRPDRWGALGFVFMALAAALASWAALTLRRHETDVRPWKPTTAIVTTGPYALTRNPIYLAFALMQLGAGLWQDSLALVLMVIPAVAATNRWVIAREEAYLARKFGELYERYLTEVRRWL
ncbi:MAG: isoprenylcysteine carboxylmethyltransferase family protein [Gemmatimonadaceae bacterium]|nr:isoprenylcysteine carboxylmethyltransferase family protein [Gemmatimonadaceae bacterium]